MKVRDRRAPGARGGGHEGRARHPAHEGCAKITRPSYQLPYHRKISASVMRARSAAQFAVRVVSVVVEARSRLVLLARRLRPDDTVVTPASALMPY